MLPYVIAISFGINVACETRPYERPRGGKLIRKRRSLLHEHRILLVGELICAEHTTNVTDGGLEDTI